nr:MAG TPA: hypothetical protein [Caudoviricetes sp.]
MKKVLLIIGLLLTVTLVNSYNYPTRGGTKANAYYDKTLEIMYDSKKRPHKIVIYSKGGTGVTAIDLDANTYK